MWRSFLADSFHDCGIIRITKHYDNRVELIISNRDDFIFTNVHKLVVPFHSDFKNIWVPEGGTIMTTVLFLISSRLFSFSVMCDPDRRSGKFSEFEVVFEDLWVNKYPLKQSPNRLKSNVSHTQEVEKLLSKLKK